MNRPAVFFMRTSDPTQVQSAEFYAQDVRFLRELGHDVRIVTRVRDLVPDLLRHGRPAVYFCWWWTWAAFPVALARLVGRPAVITGVFNYHTYPRRPWYQRVLIAFAARAAAANVFDSMLEFRHVTAMVTVREPSLSPHTVDVEHYRPPTTWSSKDPNLLLQFAWMTGGNSHRKCVGESIRAFERLASTRPQLRLVIAGERGSDYAAYAELVTELGLADRVSFPGRVSRDEKIRLMQSCAVYLQPSRFEGFGLAGVEAMACGAAMVTSDVGAVREVCGDAVLYADGTDPDDIARQAALLLDRPDERRRLGEAARRRVVEEYSPERRRQDLRAVLDRVLRPLPPSHADARDRIGARPDSR